VSCAVVTEDDRRLVIAVMFGDGNDSEWVEPWIKTGKLKHDKKQPFTIGVKVEEEWNRKAQLVADYRVKVSTEGQGKHLRWRALSEEFDGRPMWSVRPEEEDNESISSMCSGTVWWDEDDGWSTWDGEGDSLSYGHDWQKAFTTAERVYGCTADRPLNPNQRQG